MEPSENGHAPKRVGSGKGWRQSASQQDIQTAAGPAPRRRPGGHPPPRRLYGLGANGLDPAAVGRIFQAKGRPQDNPRSCTSRGGLAGAVLPGHPGGGL